LRDNVDMTTTELPATLPGAFLIRAIAPGDVAALEGFYAGLSPDSREARFHGASSVGDRAAHAFCAAEHEGRHGVVAEAIGEDGRWVIVGHLCVEPLGDATAEIAVAVADAWQHHGVGRALVLEAVSWARRHDVRVLLASVRWSNAPMLRLLRSIGRPVSFGREDAGVVDVRIPLAAPLPNAA
jgi:GNAT superfamily N-acetyltransferase